MRSMVFFLNSLYPHGQNFLGILDVLLYAGFDPTRVSLRQSFKNLLIFLKGAPNTPGKRKIINLMTNYLFTQPFIDLIELLYFSPGGSALKSSF